MAAAALAAGCTVSPALIAGFTLTERLLPQAVLTEGFAWLDAATGIGFAAGSSAGGLAADAVGANGIYGRRRRRAAGRRHRHPGTALAAPAGHPGRRNGPAVSMASPSGWVDAVGRSRRRWR